MTHSPNIAPDGELSPNSLSDRAGERGLALLSVIFAIAVLSVIALAMISANLSAARAKAHIWEKAEIDALMQAAIARAVLGISDSSLGQRWPVDGRTVSWTFDDQSIDIAIQDEAGKIDLNTANDALLHGLFKAIGLAPDAADALADKVLDWRTPGDMKRLNGATAQDYELAGYSYRPRDSAYQSIEEVKLVMDMTPQIYEKIAPAITVYSQLATIEPATAPGLALRAVSGSSAESVSALMATRQTSAGGGVPAGVLNPIIPLWGRAFSIKVTMDRHGKSYQRRAVLRLTDDPKRPYLMLEWR